METNSIEKDWQGLFSSKNWEKETPYGYSVDQLIDAYQIGKKHGRSDVDRVVKERLEQNLTKAIEASESLAGMLDDEYDISIKGMHLKIKDITSYATLIIIDEDSYLSDEMRAVYDMIGNHELELEEENFRITFEFLGVANQINKQALLSDGYIIRYKTEKSRRA